MKREFWVEKCKFVLTKDEMGYQEVLSSFKSSSYINILTFNISSRQDNLLELIEEIKSPKPVRIITNIPHRYEQYFSVKAREQARRNIKIYIKKLLPSKFEAQIIPFFNFNNHAKIISTDKIAYVGSANYSDESKNNYESGFIIYDSKFCNYLNNKIFPLLISDSEPYLNNVFFEKHILALNIFSRLELTYEDFFCNYNGFLYPREHDNKLMQQFQWMEFNIGINNLEILENLIYEIDEVFNSVDDLYDEQHGDNKNEEIQYLQNYINVQQLDNIRRLINYESNIYKLCIFNYQKYCDSYLEEYSWDAYEEKLDYYAQRSSELALEKFEELVYGASDDIWELKKNMDNLKERMLGYIKGLGEIGEINKNIDNTLNIIR